MVCDNFIVSNRGMMFSCVSICQTALGIRRLPDYGMQSKVSVTVWVCLQIEATIVEPYSNILSTLSSLEYTDVTVMTLDEAPQDICHRNSSARTDHLHIDGISVDR